MIAPVYVEIGRFAIWAHSDISLSWHPRMTALQAFQFMYLYFHKYRLTHK